MDNFDRRILLTEEEVAKTAILLDTSNMYTGVIKTLYVPLPDLNTNYSLYIRLCDSTGETLIPTAMNYSASIYRPFGYSNSRVASGASTSGKSGYSTIYLANNSTNLLLYCYYIYQYASNSASSATPVVFRLFPFGCPVETSTTQGKFMVSNQDGGTYNTYYAGKYLAIPFGGIDSYTPVSTSGTIILNYCKFYNNFSNLGDHNIYYEPLIEE